MRLTIIPSDNFVAIDEEGRQIDCASFASLTGIHAVQWYDVGGHVEYINPPGTKPDNFRANEEITSIDQFQEVIDAWEAWTPPPPPPPP